MSALAHETTEEAVGRIIAEMDDAVLLPVKQGVPEFQCPTCGHRARNDATGLEPLCTGPNAGLNEHVPTVMEFRQLVDVSMIVVPR